MKTHGHIKNTHMHIHNKHIYIHTYIHAYILTYINTYIHTYIHTNILHTYTYMSMTVCMFSKLRHPRFVSGTFFCEMENVMLIPVTHYRTLSVIYQLYRTARPSMKNAWCLKEYELFTYPNTFRNTLVKSYASNGALDQVFTLFYARTVPSFTKANPVGLSKSNNMCINVMLGTTENQIRVLFIYAMKIISLTDNKIN